MTEKPKVYLAGPGVFHPDAERIGIELKALCMLHGLDGLWPADNEPPPPQGPEMPDTPFGRASFIYRSNLMMLSAAAAVIADISPFRGPHMDPGTAFEIGAAAVSGRPIFGYTSVFIGDAPTLLIDRVRSCNTPTGRRDRDAILVEDFGFAENLMIECSLLSLSLFVEDAIAECAKHLRGAKA